MQRVVQVLVTSLAGILGWVVGPSLGSFGSPRGVASGCRRASDPFTCVVPDAALAWQVGAALALAVVVFIILERRRIRGRLHAAPTLFVVSTVLALVGTLYAVSNAMFTQVAVEPRAIAFCDAFERGGRLVYRGDRRDGFTAMGHCVEGSTRRFGAGVGMVLAAVIAGASGLWVVGLGSDGKPSPVTGDLIA